MRENDTDSLFRGSDLVLAFSLLSRLPVRTFANPSEAGWQRQSEAVWAFPIVGAVLGSIGASVVWATMQIGLPPIVAAGLALTIMILCTGAMHEDGLADCADGFWGGWTREQRLEIMKDSQIGTYGVLALILITALRWIGYGALLTHGLAGIVAAAALSRGVLPGIMAALPHARADGLSRSVGRPERRIALIALAIGFTIAALGLGWGALGATALAIAAATVCAALARNKIGGQTGDVLGASQQLSELAVIMFLIAQTG